MTSEILNIVDDKKYNNLIVQKIKFLRFGLRFSIKIILIKNENQLRDEGIINGGKVVWQDTSNKNFKLANELKIDALNLKHIPFLAIFLHECGHIEDSNNLKIQLKSNESEISAWKQAYISFNGQNPSKKDSDLFVKKMQESLATYNIPIESIIKKSSF